MRAHIVYFWYVIQHKWFVFIECCRLGVIYRGVVHDLSKLRPSEWFPYVHSFYNPDGSKRNVRDETGYYDPTKMGAEFDRAWLFHQHRNPHHWQYWLLTQDKNKNKEMPMPDTYRKEMLADWRGAGKAQGKPNTYKWYLANKDKMKLHPETRAWIEEHLK